MNRGERLGVLVVFALMVIVMIPSVSAINKCYIDTDCTRTLTVGVDYEWYGYVSAQGHFSDTSPTGTIDYPLQLCCPDFWPFGFGSGSFLFASQDDGNHVSFDPSPLTTFDTTVLLGTKECQYLVGVADCPIEMACVFKMSNPDNSHVMDCSQDDFPVDNDYDGKLCCKPYELCWDSIDNDEDGFIDCADDDCYGGPAGDFPGEPQECTYLPLNPLEEASMFNTTSCINGFQHPDAATINIDYNASCLGQDGDYYYCSYGPKDNYTNPGAPNAPYDPGVCCPQEYHGVSDGAGGWNCVFSDQCDDGECGQDFWHDWSGWMDNVYNVPADGNWCVSEIPDLFSPGHVPNPQSTACCIRTLHGNVDHYTDEANVKIWG